MKIYSVSIYSRDSNEETIRLAAEYDLSSFGFFQRSTVQDIIMVISKTIAERTSPGQRQRVEEQPYVGYVYARSDTHLTGVIVTDEEYPQRVSFSVLNKILDEFLIKFPPNDWSKPDKISFPELKTYLIKYQDPKQADQITKVQEQLDETKLVMNKTIESLLQRGEKLDDLIDRSQEISFQSKAFYKQARKTNSCCTIS
ncbi:snare-like protein [Rhizophagus diaphanus]|nr:snare-like protein [Rhizophagus diaphanus] [Rhizophagus sp. MUCL 43196]